MKKIITLVFFVICSIAYSYGQQNVYGGDFEHWKLNTKWHYYEPDSSMFKTLNILDSVGNGIAVYPCDTAHSGSHSVRLVTHEITILTILVPGVIGNLKINWLTFNAVLGIPYPYGTTLPLRFSGFYKSYPIDNDSSAAVLLLSKWNTGTHKRDTIAYNRLSFHGIVDTWTSFDTAVTYFDHTNLPDTITFLLLSSAGFNTVNMQNCVGTVGSQALFDDINLTGVNGFPLMLMPAVKVKLSPNPSSTSMKIDLGSDIENGYFEVYDSQAKFIRRISISGTSGQINVNDLSSGSYLYKLTQGSKLLNSGKFIVVK
jgi:hypothetical protein